MPFCRACHADSEGTVCGWCGRTFEAAAAAVDTAARRKGRGKWLLVMAVAVGVPGLGLAAIRVTPSAVRTVKTAPGVAQGLAEKGHDCRWTVGEAGEPGRDGWKLVRCQLQGAGDG